MKIERVMKMAFFIYEKKSQTPSDQLEKINEIRQLQSDEFEIEMKI